VRVTKADFENVRSGQTSLKVSSSNLIQFNKIGQALSEVLPAFGVSTTEFANAAPNGIINYGEAFAHVMKTCAQQPSS